MIPYFFITLVSFLFFLSEDPSLSVVYAYVGIWIGGVF
jgi:hypothetical protein